MFNKNDPLIGAVQEVMRKNQAERDAVRAVNEKFGVIDRRALPHEQQANWDAAYAKVLTEGIQSLNEAELSPKQKKLAAIAGNKKKIDAPDLAAARKGHASHIEEEQIDEISGAMASRYLQAKTKRDYDKKGSMYTSKKSKSFKDMDKDIKGDIRALKTIERDKKKTSPSMQKEEALDEIADTPRGKEAVRRAVHRADANVVHYAINPPKGKNEKREAKNAMKTIDRGIAVHKKQGKVLDPYLKRAYGLKKEEHLEEKAVSKAQHRFFGLVRGIQKGEATGSAKAKEAAASMSTKEVRKFAKTKEKGLPEKK